MINRNMERVARIVAVSTHVIGMAPPDVYLGAPAKSQRCCSQYEFRERLTVRTPDTCQPDAEQAGIAELHDDR